MKYLKTYENVTYKKGDYILLDTSSNDWSTEPYKFAKILRVDKTDDYVYLDAVQADTYEPFNFWFNCDKIIRFLTPEEIKDIELKIIANNYNL